MAQFVDISTLTDVSASFPNSAWIQTSATQKADVNKVYNNTGFISGLKSKLNLSGLSIGFNGSKLLASDNYLTAFNKLGSNLYEVEEILSAPDTHGDYHPGSTSKSANTLCVIAYYTSTGGNSCYLDLSSWISKLTTPGSSMSMTIIIPSYCRFKIDNIHTHLGTVYQNTSIKEIMNETSGSYDRILSIIVYHSKDGQQMDIMINGGLYTCID